MSNYIWMSKDLYSKSIYISEYESAWKISCAKSLISEALQNQVIILGGDILNLNLEYTDDNWYYEPNKAKDINYNSIKSCNCMENYLKKYIDLHGVDYYIIIVCVTKL